MREPILRRWRLVVLLWLLQVGPDVAKEEEEEDLAAKYLYYQDDAKAFVHDFQPSDAEDPRFPAFLYAKGQGPRIVEFYAPWCPHCQHFRDHYVHFAKQVKAVAEEDGLEIGVHAVSCQVHRSICHDFDVHSYPKIHLFAAGATNSTGQVNYWNVHPFDILNKLGLVTDQVRFEDYVPQGAPKHHSHSIDGHRRTKQEVFDDAYLSFAFAMKNGVFMSNAALTNSTSLALWYWLDLLTTTMPPTWSIQNLLKALLTDFENITKSEAALVQIVDQYPAPTKKWSLSCTKGDPAMGYTCGLWQLFHIMTVGVVEWNLMVGSDDTDEMMVSINDSAVRLRNFIEHFFGCEVCRINFLSAFDSCAHQRCTRLVHRAMSLEEWIQLPVWLFETHNSVNIRLLREKNEREGLPPPTHDEEIAKTWPSRRDCPACWERGGGYSDMTLYKFLRMEYWPEDGIAKGYREELFRSAGANDDDQAIAASSVWIHLLPVVLLIGLALGWYIKHIDRKRTGYHKKNDSPGATNGYPRFANGV